MISQNDIDAQLVNTESLFATIHHFDCTPDVLPGKSSRGAAITYSDLVERRSDFVRELRNSICGWVFSKSKFASMLQTEMTARGQDAANAVSHLVDLSRSKFRPGHTQGQFGELLLFNFIEHFFKAPPLLRKMPITTNPSIERHGADAMHLGITPDGMQVYLGEAKAYTSKYKFNTALEDAVESILKAHQDLQRELDLYVYDEFIEPPFKEVADAIKRNSLSYTVELVLVVAYTETTPIEGPTETTIKTAIERTVRNRISLANCKALESANPHIVNRMHFFLVPFWDLDSLLADFAK